MSVRTKPAPVVAERSVSWASFDECCLRAGAAAPRRSRNSVACGQASQ